MMHATTILCVRKNGKVAMGGDGQVSLGNTVMKHSAKKVRKMHHDNSHGSKKSLRNFKATWHVQR